MSIPERILEAIVGLNPDLTVELAPPIKPVPGMLALIRPVREVEGRCIGLITHIDDENETISIALTSNEIEMATDIDLIVSSDDTKLPFSLLMEAELYGPIFSEQIVGIVGNIGKMEFDSFRNSLLTDGESIENFNIGLPLSGPHDQRRLFKHSEFERLQPYVEYARDWLAGRPGFITSIHPSMLVPPPPGTPQGEAVMKGLEVLDLLESLSKIDFQQPSELLAILEHDGMMPELSRWRTEFGIDVARSISRLNFSKTSEITLNLETDPNRSNNINIESEDQFSSIVASSSIPSIDYLVGENLNEFSTMSHIFRGRQPTNLCRVRVIQKEKVPT